MLVNDKPRLFLLGGHDLEMAEIKKLLEAHNERYLDYNLSWGAKLSAYKKELGFKGNIYGIELEEDIFTPLGYFRIDHHNELSHLPASIEQVATVLGVVLTRDQKIIAANDSGYIPAMKNMGATEQEIVSVRLKDRQAQGISTRDELLGEQSILENLTWDNNVAIVKALTPHFPTITDRLYGKASHMILYTDEKLVYYGPGIDKLVKKLASWIPIKAYYGGGSNGFFGIKDKVFTSQQLRDEVLPIIIKTVAI